MKFINLGFKWSEGKFYEKSSEPKEGFKEVKYTDKETKKEAVTYHKTVDSITGKIHAVISDQTTWGAKVLKVLVNTGNDECTVIQVDLKDKYGYSRETKAFLSSLRDYIKGEEVVITPKITEYTNPTTSKVTKNLNIYMNYVNILNDDGKGKMTGYINFNEVPALEKVEKRGETTYNNDAQQDFYYEVLMKVLEKLPKGTSSNTNDNSNGGQENTEAPKQEKPKKSDTPTVNNSSDNESVKQGGSMQPNTKFEDDDLPF